ncbi:MAG: nucleotidyltransferase domain-containing protein [Anaerolineae bacterium]
MNQTVSTYQQIAKGFAQLLERELGEELTSVVLYGSVARGDASQDSDIDLLIVVNATSREEKKAIKKRVLDLCIDFETSGPLAALFEQGQWTNIEYQIYTREEALRTHLFYLDMTQDAVLLFDQEGFFAAKLDRVRQRMEELGTRREYFEDGCWYWILKADMKPGEEIEL